MKKIKLLFLINVFFISITYSQISSLVHIGANGKLEYGKYANTGEDTIIHQIPDFSFAGYKKGGVKLPDVPVVNTIEPVEGDNYTNIQNAIDQVSNMPLDENGFRGAIFFKAGKYDCGSPLQIKESGIVLKGEGQNFAENGGTQIHATANYQHDFINFEGNEISALIPLQSYLDTIIVPQKDAENDGNIWLKGNVTTAVESEARGDRILTIYIIADANDFCSYTSKEGENKPYLEITYRPDGETNDSVFNLYPTDDAFVRGGEFADDNFGSAISLPVKYAGENNRVTREVYFKFSLPEIKGEIDSAYLNLWCNNAGNSTSMKNYLILIKDDNWSESTITYNTRVGLENSAQRITSEIVAVGSRSFEVEDASIFAVGDQIAIVRTPNQFWIDDLGMGQAALCGSENPPDCVGWTPTGYRVEYENEITSIQGNVITVEVPIVQAIDVKYGGGEIYLKNTTGKVENCGVENMLISSAFSGINDENHGWNAIALKQTVNCWVKNVTAKNFGYACVTLEKAFQTTVEDCAMIDPISITTGGRKYSFNISNGSNNLFQRCYTRGGRHDYVTGARVAGPNVFMDCVAENTFSDIGPHHRYATGLLFDNVQGGDIRVQNRGNSGTGHGWSGAQTMFWNVKANWQLKIESPKGAMNWGIGCSAYTKAGAGYWESYGQEVLPRSLYLQQLKDRLGDTAVINITIPEQLEGNIYDKLSSWAGISDINTSAFSNHIEQELKFYPNPCRDMLHLTTNLKQDDIVSVYTIQGKEQNVSMQKQGNTIQINTSSLKSGLYLLRIISSDKTIKNDKFIKL